MGMCACASACARKALTHLLVPFDNRGTPEACPFQLPISDCGLFRTRSIYPEHVLPIQNTFYLSRTHSIQNTFYRERMRLVLLKPAMHPGVCVRARVCVCVRACVCVRVCITPEAGKAGHRPVHRRRPCLHYIQSYCVCVCVRARVCVTRLHVRKRG